MKAPVIAIGAFMFLVHTTCAFVSKHSNDRRLSTVYSSVTPDEFNRDKTVKRTKSQYKNIRTVIKKDPSLEYWFDQRIHTLGNTGFSGAMHAAMATAATKLIDVAAYNGVNLRNEISLELARMTKKSDARILDLCCGVGTSTRALASAFPHAETIIGVDTSAEMVAMADFISGHLSFIRNALPFPLVSFAEYQWVTRDVNPVKFARGNAEDTKLPAESFDIITIMYAFHEAPMLGRQKILKEACRLLRPDGVLTIVDIASDYKPSESMLAGEPYVLEFQRNFQRQLADFTDFSKAQYKTVVPGHVGMWILRRKPKVTQHEG